MKNLMLLKKFIQHPVHCLDEIQAMSSDLVQVVYLGPKRVITIFDPEIATKVLMHKSDLYRQSRSIFHKIRPVTGKKGLVQLQGQESRFFRQKSREIFTPGNLLEFKNIIEEYTQDALAEIEDKTIIPISTVMTDLILRTAFKMFLGIDSKNQVTQMGKNFLELNKLCGKKMLSPFSLPFFIPTKENRKIAKLKVSLRGQIKTLIQSSTRSKNVVSVFQNEESLIDQCMTFLFAGHETTASSLAFSFLLLAKYPEYQNRIQNQEEGLILKVYQESLRLFPPAYMLAREALSDDVLGDVQVKKGDQVLIGLRQIQRLEKYFPQAQEFYPERFSMLHQIAFFPFGRGPKACIGENLAYMEAEIVLKLFCEKFTFKSISDDITIKPLITLHPENQNIYVQLN